jgi:hypothetical protein
LFEVIIMKTENNSANEMGSIGIGAMIVFIALILVAAVASAVIIQTGEKLQQNAQQTGSDTQREIGGKITLKEVVIFDNTQVTVFFESSPGSDVLAVEDIAWQAACNNRDPNGDGNLDQAGDNAGYQFVAGVFGDGIAGNEGPVAGTVEGDGTGNDDNPNFAYLETFMGPTDDDLDGKFGDSNDDTAAADDGADTPREALTITPGENYVITMNLDGAGNTGNDCGIVDLNINDEITLWIHVEGGGSTYETMFITDKTPGGSLV